MKAEKRKARKEDAKLDRKDSSDLSPEALKKREIGEAKKLKAMEDATSMFSLH
jgi:hypothetical protein